jgi:ClpP class serine protease
MTPFATLLSQSWAMETRFLSALLSSVRDPQSLALFRGRQDSAALNMEIRGSSAIIPIRGVISPRPSFFEEIFGITLGANAQTIAADLGRAAGLASIERIILSIDSPGGNVVGISELATYIREISKTKKVVAYVEGRASSAAYWLASAASEILSAPTGIVGSIGTLVAFDDYSKMNESIGIEEITIVSNLSPNKALDPRTAEGRAETVRILDSLTEVFVSDVALGRGETRESVLEKFGQGLEFSASEAISRGMIDAVSTFEAIFSDNTPKPTKTRGGKMDAKALRETYPEAVAQIENDAISAVQTEASAEAEAKTSGLVSAALDAERARVSALMAHYQKSPELVAAAINGGESIEAFALKMLETSQSSSTSGDAGALARLQAAASEANPETSQVENGQTKNKTQNPIRALVDKARGK